MLSKEELSTRVDSIMEAYSHGGREADQLERAIVEEITGKYMISKGEEYDSQAYSRQIRQHTDFHLAIAKRFLDLADSSNARLYDPAVRQVNAALNVNVVHTTDFHVGWLESEAAVEYGLLPRESILGARTYNADQLNEGLAAVAARYTEIMALLEGRPLTASTNHVAVSYSGYGFDISSDYSPMSVSGTYAGVVEMPIVEGVVIDPDAGFPGDEKTGAGFFLGIQLDNPRFSHFEDEGRALKKEYGINVATQPSVTIPIRTLDNNWNYLTYDFEAIRERFRNKN